MEKNDIKTEIKHQIYKAQSGHRRGRITAGILIVTFGTLYLLKTMKFGIPGYVLSWPMILIGLGIVELVKHKFRKLHAYLLILVGNLFLFAQWYPDVISKQMILPIVLILIGLVFIFKPKRSRKFKHGHKFNKENWQSLHSACDHISEEDFIDSVSVFGGIKKNVVSKQFKGADIVSFFGGTEINLSQADFNDRVVFDVTNIFGGTTLTIPSNWRVISEVTTIFGGFDDKRPEQSEIIEDNVKVMIIRGTCLFGGIEVNSYAK